MKYFGIIPAAGQSLRMGPQHKLLLPWKNASVIDQVLLAWTESHADRVVVIVLKDDAQLQKACRRWPNADLVIPEEYFETENVKILLDTICSGEFRERVEGLGGYGTEKTGEIVPISSQE